MLARTANGVFWMARYLERAENSARLLDAGFRIALTRGDHASADEWRSVLVTIGLEHAFAARGLDYTGPAVCNFILRDKDNPASVLAMIEQARTNARMVRTAITREVWEATNEAWMTLCEVLARPVREANLGDTLALIRRQTTQVRGAMDGTMLRNEIFNFARIGTFIERADNTARILDVKYYVLLPSVSAVGSSLDNVQWESILRPVSAHRSSSGVYAAEYRPANIADFLILNGQMPRSLAYCYEKIVSNLGYLAKDYGERLPAHDTADSIRKTLKTRAIKEIMDQGLHEFLEDFVTRNNQLGMEI